MLLTVTLAGCTGMAARDPSARRGPAPVPTTTAQPAATVVPNDRLVKELRGGGYTLLVPHGATDGQPDRDGPALNNCELQANLTDSGRGDARALGMGLRRMGIPVGDVWASPFCRSRDTAWLAFGQLQVTWSLAPPPAAGPRRASAAHQFRALLAAAPREAANTVLVTHPSTVSAMVGANLEAGEALVYEPVQGQPARLVRRIHLADLIGLARAKPVTAPALARGVSVRTYPLPAGSHPFAVVAYPHGGGIWFTAARAGALGQLDPRTGRSRMIPLGRGSSPRGVTVGPDGALWVADRGRNAILKVNAVTGEVAPFPLPARAGRAELTAVGFDARGRLWFTGRRGTVGWLDPDAGQVRTVEVPAGATPEGLVVTAAGKVWYASSGDGRVARVDPDGAVQVRTPPTRGAGVREAAASPSAHGVWFTEADAGRIARLDTETGSWSEWRLPGAEPRPSALYVDRAGQVWVTDAAANTLLRFDPVTERFAVLDLPVPEAGVLDLAGAGSTEVWGAASTADRLLQIRITPPQSAGKPRAAAFR